MPLACPWGLPAKGMAGQKRRAPCHPGGLQGTPSPRERAAALGNSVPSRVRGRQHAAASRVPHCPCACWVVAPARATIPMNATASACAAMRARNYQGAPQRRPNNATVRGSAAARSAACASTVAHLHPPPLAATLPLFPFKSDKDDAETVQAAPKVAPGTTLGSNMWRHSAALNGGQPPRNAIELPIPGRTKEPS